MLLIVLKQNGLAARGAAEFLGLSAATISYWRAAREGKVRGAGVPTDEHLAKLVTLLRYQFEQNHNAIHTLLHEPDVREIEKILLLKSMLPQVNQSVRHFNADMRQWKNFAQSIRNLVEKHGSKNVDATLITIPGDEGAAGSEWFAPAPGIDHGLPLGLMMMNSEEFLRRFDGAEAESEKLKETLSDFFKEKWRRMIAAANRRTKVARRLAPRKSLSGEREDA